MRLLLSSALLGLTWFAAVNILASLAGWMLCVWTLRRVSVLPARRTAASALLAARLLPAVASSIFALTVFLPAHVRFEPSGTDESFGFVLAGLAALGLWLALSAAWRFGRASLAASRFVGLARRACTPVRGAAHGEAFAIGGLPGVSLAGIWRPRILVGSHALAALTPAELDVAIAHEVAHRRSRDNLKRLVMFCAPDLIRWTRVGRQIEEQWQAEAECEADACAVMGDGQRAVALASALVKVARLGGDGTFHPISSATPLALTALTMSSAFHVPTLLERRVRRLVSGSAEQRVASVRLGWSLAALCLGVPTGAWLLEFSYRLHLVTEALVTHLP